ncbi:olfactory receptor 14I1 [Fundulus heteroclitus]|uniref:olfactory receptor 14I1 n=1 Tax=Fundulus heteroclitus TaxID=8078 RepID=UPI00165C6215|nr:olfactory receptor 14I1 [Fundulus heteroclitus]
MPNRSSECPWHSPENQTEPRVTDHQARAEHLFHFIIPYEPTVPALICLFVVLTVFSLLANVVTVYIIQRSDDLSWQPRFVFCKNLILSDLLQTVTFAPPVIYSLAEHQTMAFSGWCYIQYVVGGASIFSSLTTITCMALERYLFVCFALQYTVMVTQERIRTVVILVWVYSISYGLLSLGLVLYEGRQEDDAHVTMGLLCEPDIIEQHMGSPRAPAIFRKVMGSLTLLLCLLVHAFSYFKMYRNASNAVVPFNESNTAARRTVLFYCGMLFLQLLPLLVKVASDALWEFRGTGAIELSSGSRGHCEHGPSATAAVFHLALLALVLVPPCVNPLVYGLRSVELRTALTKLLPWRTRNRGDEGRPREIVWLRNIVHPGHPEAG